VQHERADQQGAVADSVREDRADDDRDAEADEAAAGDRPQVGLGEPELAGPVAQDGAADGEADAGGDQRQKARQEDPPLACRAERSRVVRPHRTPRVIRHVISSLSL
jgi:hypothetical protein